MARVNHITNLYRISKYFPAGVAQSKPTIETLEQGVNYVQS